MSYLDDAHNFEFKETAFHLGFLPTEQSNPQTATMEMDFQKSTADGIRTLQSVDRNVLLMAQKIFASKEFEQLCNAVLSTIKNGNNVVFSGCGATGRLSILLEKIWRSGCSRYANQVKSIMTGGDYALVKSVEAFEDHAAFGARQVHDLKMTSDDLLIAITEGGETSSVLGTVKEFTRLGGKAFLLFNNPADILCAHLERSREAIENPAVTVLDLSCGPMALAGSTRMQATTCEQLVASAALEFAACRLYHRDQPGNFAENFACLLDTLESVECVDKMAQQIDFETEIYRKGGRVTYFADDYMLDLFTDTTERSPTFMLPGFHPIDDTRSPEPWAFVRNPLYNAKAALKKALGNRELRCLEWTALDYMRMNAPQRIIDNPPQITADDLAKIPLGNEYLPSRYETKADAAVLFYYFAAPAEFEFAVRAEAVNYSKFAKFNGDCGKLPRTMLKIFEHLAVKLQWNTISTGTMVRMGRVSGNWMSHVAISNKKLIDRAIRLVSELGKVDYHTACVELFRSIAEPDGTPAVQQTLKRLS